VFFTKTNAKVSLLLQTVNTFAAEKCAIGSVRSDQIRFSFTHNTLRKSTVSLARTKNRSIPLFIKWVISFFAENFYILNKTGYV